MIKKILIANRGEIAVRIIRACKEMGIKAVAVHSDADHDAVHTHLADESVCVGGARSKDSYLNIQNIISAAVLTGADAIHPGFGFLSENESFAEVCRECGIIFIGPDAKIISLMGNKAKARETMKNAGVPIIQGSEGIIDNIDNARKIANEIGYPVMVKASSGGGGRGIRIINHEDELERTIEKAKAEAESAFGDSALYMEKFIEQPRHVEFQILGDTFGNVIHLGERDCSIQRRNQKILEESPCTALDNELREKMGEAAIKAAKAVNYINAGTIEFLLDKNNHFYFMEMNTRIQVEHPVTEMVTGIDLIKEQIKIASGMKLDLSQEDIEITGHAIECRINAEDPDKNFMPSAGEINIFHLPGGLGVRLESAIYNGYKILPFYDSMLGKLIVHGTDREDAIRRMKRALDEFIIDGIKTNIEFHKRILDNKSFIEGKFDTGFVSKEFGL